ncbi:MAG: hypothetical protein ACI4MH_04275 [Candidatus Coproplasma sp.]
MKILSSEDGNRFIFTALGAAMGLGNAMRFPGLCYAYGGAFVIAYALALAVQYPLLCAELSLGKSTRAPFPVALRSAVPRSARYGRAVRAATSFSGAVGWAACVNSAVIACYYISVIADLTQSACTFGVTINFDCPADMPGLTPVFAILCALALGYLLTRSAKVRSELARVAVTAQVALFALLAARGLIYENAFVALGALSLSAEGFLNPNMWLSAFGQSLLSLSVAAGVMPSFAVNMPRAASPKRCALIISCANFVGGMLATVALVTVAAGCNLSGQITLSGFSNALTLFPQALAVTFKNPIVSGIFGTVFLLSLALTAVVSALSLSFPLFSSLKAILPSVKARAAVFCAVFAVSGIAFGVIPNGVEFCDFLTCNVIAPVIAWAESCLFFLRVLTELIKRDKISVWKIYLKLRKN